MRGVHGEPLRGVGGDRVAQREVLRDVVGRERGGGAVVAGHHKPPAGDGGQHRVRSVFRAAVRDRVIAADPSEGVLLPRQRRRDAATEIPTLQEVSSLLDAASDDSRLYLSLCMFSGLRLGEAAAIQVGDIDFLRRTLKVRRQVQRAGGKNVEIRPPKYGSERNVYLPDELIKDLSGHISRNNLRGKPDAWLFSGEGNMNPPHQNTVGATLRRTCARAKVTGYTLHDLRHFFASAMIASGCDVVTVQRAMGHASATTTLRTYAHLWPTAEDRTRKSASDLINSVRHASLVKSRQDHRQQIGNTEITQRSDQR